MMFRMDGLEGAWARLAASVACAVLVAALVPTFAQAEVYDERYPDGTDGKIIYIERDWDGRRVTEKTVEEAGAKVVPANGKLTGGTYYFPRNAENVFKDRMVVTADTKLVLLGNAWINAQGGIYVQKGATLSIYGVDREGDASHLFVKTDQGAGIGAYPGHKGGNVVIHGGFVKASGGKNCAGIGSNDGDGSDVGCVTVYGGTVVAVAGDQGAAIGGGRKSEAKVEIYGGDVTASCSTDGAGIGGGNGADGGSIDIFGGTVTTHHRDGAGIGGGEDGDGGTIYIFGGSVKSYYEGQGNGAGIGGGNHSGNGGTIKIYAGSVVVDNNHGAGIGGGRADDAITVGDESGDGGDITITGGVVEATASRAFGIGAGGRGCSNPNAWFREDEVGSMGTIAIGGDADVTATGFYAGIGGDDGTITIDGGMVTAKGGTDEEGGSGILGANGTLTMRGGELYAQAFKEKACGALAVQKMYFEGGMTDATAVGCCMYSRGDTVIKGPDTLVQVRSEKRGAIEGWNRLRSMNVAVREGATFEAWSPELPSMPIAIDDSVVCMVGPSEREVSKVDAGENGSVEIEENTGYIHIGPAA